MTKKSKKSKILSSDETFSDSLEFPATKIRVTFDYTFEVTSQWGADELDLFITEYIDSFDKQENGVYCSSPENSLKVTRRVYE